MWVRKRIEIGWGELARGAAYTLLPLAAPTGGQIAATLWPRHDDVVACLTVRSGLDLLLEALDWPPGDEVLMSAVTIGDMVRIVHHHRLVTVPVDVDDRDMSPRMESIEKAVTPRTRAILVAHLFGAIFSMEPIIEWAKPRGILVIEDCAQAFDGRYLGHPESDVVMFSFGPIKTATALGGGLLRIQDPEVCRSVRELHATWPGQSRAAFLKRIVTYSVLKGLSGRLAFRMLVAACRVANRDHDSLLNGAVRNISGDFLAGLRQRPSPPLLRLMRRRVHHFAQPRLEQRATRGRLLRNLLARIVSCPGGGADAHSSWLFPARFDDTRRIQAALLRSGFDATNGGQLRVVEPPTDREELDPSHARQALANHLYLPVYPEMPESEVERMARVVLESVRPDAEADTDTSSDI